MWALTPPFLYGTAWKEEDTERCVRDALEVGFRGIDTANQRKHYFEAGVGAALRASQIPRAELFLQTKFTFQAGQDQRLPYDPKAPIATQVHQSFESSLEHLHTDYLDSLVLHGPSSRSGLTETDWEAWQAMESLHQQNKIKFLGVSNVSLAQLQELCERAKVKPKFAQIRCYARAGWDLEIRNYCHEQEIIYQGFSLLTANPQALSSERVRNIAKGLNATPAQIIFAFARQVGMLPLTGTKDPVHMQEDLQSCSLTLSAVDLKCIEQITQGT